MSLIRRVVTGTAPEVRNDPLAFDQWLDYFNYNGLAYPITTMGGFKVDEPGADFLGYVHSLYKTNGIVFACMATRMLLFAEARFQFQQMRNGRPGDLFGTQALSLFEHPGGVTSSQTTGDMLSRMIQDADLAGNWFGRRPGRVVRSNGRVVNQGANVILRMRPDWVVIIAGSETGSIEDAVPVGYTYTPGGLASGNDPIPLLVEEVAHFAPIPDPEQRFKGMSWLTPVIREVMGDQAGTTHKLRYYENAATPNLLVQAGDDIRNPDQFDFWVEKFKYHHEGSLNKFKTLFLSRGADAKPLGSSLKDANFAEVQAGGETRIAAAAGVPPVIAGLTKGLESSTYSNYSQARRRFADGTMRPLWRNAAGSLASIIDVPASARLWYDDRDVAFLREDEKDKAEIQQTSSQTVKALVEAGFEPASVVAAVDNDDFTLLEHTGLYSVQLQKPGTEAPSAPAPVDAPPERKLLEAANDKTGRALLALLPGSSN